MILSDIEKFSADIADNDARNYISQEEAISPEAAGLRIFDTPIFGVAAADDPIFNTFRQPNVVGEIFRTPETWLNGAVSVVSFFLSFSGEVRVSNRVSDEPSANWLHARIEGQEFVKKLTLALCELIKKDGSFCVAPTFEPEFKMHVSEDRTVHSSTWSERHIAYAAGLGAFGLSRSFITKRGTAGRYSSLVTTLPLPPTPRESAYALDFCDKCGACVPRCPVGAIDAKTGMDKLICENYLEKMREKFRPRYGCGKCQTKVPCEHIMPGTAAR